MEPGANPADDAVIVAYPFALRGGNPKRVYVPKTAGWDAWQIKAADPWKYGGLAQLYAEAARGGSFVEVGANLGSDTVLASDFFKICYAFEPGAANRALLQKTLALNDICNVQVLSAAVSDQPGKANFYLKQGGGTGAHSLHPNDPDMIPREEVEVTTLDSGLPPTLIDVTYLHIDTEGHDIKVLRGARKFLARQAKRPVIRLEFQPRTLAMHGSNVAELNAFISEFGYNVFYCTENHMVPLNQRILVEMFGLWQDTRGWIDLYLSPG
jgi:FkbM family methyltransferase